MRDRILLHIPDKVLVERTVGGADGPLHKGIDFAGCDVELRQGCRRALAGDFERARAFDVSLSGFGEQEDGDAFDDGVAISAGADEGCILVREGEAVTGTD